MTNDKQYDLTFSHSELVFTVECVKWSIEKMLADAIIDEFGVFREHVNFPMFQNSMSTKILVYGRLLQQYMSLPEDDQLAAWVTMFSFTENQWKLIDAIEGAESWDKVNHMSETEYEEFIRT
jgi:hypothetical protein